MSKSYKNKLSPIKEPIHVTFERLIPMSILKRAPRVHGAPPPRYDAHGNLVKLPVKSNVSRRSKKRRRRKKCRKTKKNLAGCACSNYGNCDCRRRAEIEMRERRLREQRERVEREEWLRQENLRILNDAKQYNLKDEDGNDFTIENLEDAKIALNKYLKDEENHKSFIQALKNERVLTEDVAVPMGIPIATSKWQKLKNFFKRQSRKVQPVSIVNESGKRKTCKKKRKRRRKKNVAGENDMCKGLHNFLNAQKDPSLDVPFVSTMGANRYCRRRNFKRCDFDEGKCIEALVSQNSEGGRRKRTRKKKKRKGKKTKRRRKR